MSRTLVEGAGGRVALPSKVLCDRADYDWAKQVLAERGIAAKCGVLFSPVFHQLNPTNLADWVLTDKLPVRMQVQLHKILWGETPGK